MGQKIRTYPPSTGGSVYIRTVPNEELQVRSVGYLQRMGFRGIVKIDHKCDQVEGNLKNLEINTRYNLWNVLGAYAGVNLATIAHNHQTCGKTPKETRLPYTDDLRFLFFKMALSSYLTGNRKTSEWSFLSYLRSVIKKSHYRVFNIKDPVPSVISAGRFIFRVLSRGAQKINKRIKRKIDPNLDDPHQSCNESDAGGWPSSKQCLSSYQNNFSGGRNIGYD